MEKDTRLINIYLKIHHKRTLTLRDLDYLAKYDPECFEKTCKNVVYNIPAAKPIMIPESPEPAKDEPRPEPAPVAKEPEWENIKRVLENLKHLEMDEFPVVDIDADKVKDLLGNLYMEMLFPHNDKYPFVGLTDDVPVSMFDKKA